MLIVRTREGTHYLKDKVYSLDREIRWPDWYVLAGIDEADPTDVDSLISDADTSYETISREQIKSAIRRLFEAGYIEQVEE